MGHAGTVDRPEGNEPNPGPGLPRHLDPMKATTSTELPAEGQGWGLEVKWDGARVLAFVSPGEVRLQSRNGRDVTASYPELAGLADALGGREAALDGEVVAFGPDGRPSFHLLGQRMHVSEPREVARRRQLVPVVYVVFDVLHLDGRPTLELEYRERRRLLESLGLDGACWQTPPYHLGDGPALLQATRDQGLEGLVAKRLDSAYQPGRRSPAWLKIKNRCRQELVVGGYLAGDGARAGYLGALLVGYYHEGALRYGGRVGTGFSQAELAVLERLLAGLSRTASPFTAPPELPPEVRRHGRFVQPELVVEVAFGEWSPAGVLRHPVYLGRRDDTDPAKVVRET